MDSDSDLELCGTPPEITAAANIAAYADSSSQYDAIRAYLKELDITEKVWIGLSKSSDKPNFSWTDFRPLSGEGHWQEALPAGDSQSLCAVMDPAADFLWRPLPCGGPEVAAFICELPIPSWASGPKGCLLTELPSLTVLYIPEQSALELTSDCGLDGTKRIACKGNADREEILRQLTCVISNEDIDEDKSTKASTSDYYETSTSDENSVIGKTLASNTISVDYGMPTRHRRETEDTLSPVSTKSSFKEVQTENITWQDIHREKTVLTTQRILFLDEHVTPATSFNITKADNMVTVSGDVSVLNPNKSNDVLLNENNNNRDILLSSDGEDDKILMHSDNSENATTSSEPHVTITTDRSKITEVSTLSTKESTNHISSEKFRTQTPDATVGTSTQEGNIEEYPSAINQGQLFSIIDNGTMFDIIELNETYPELQPQANKTQNQGSVTTTSNTNTERSTTHIPLTNTSSYAKIPTKKYNTKKPIQPTKKYNKQFPSKKDVLENKQVTTLKPPIPYSVNKTKEDLTKEFEMLPVIKDTSIKLNRTFRKDVPPLTDENTELESGSQFGVPKIINFTVSNTLDFGNESQAEQSINISRNYMLSEKDYPNAEKPTTENVESNLDRSDNLSKSTKITSPIEYHKIDSQVDIKPTETVKTGLNLNSKDSTQQNNLPTQETIEHQNPIDPRIYMLNHSPNMPINNESEPVTSVKSTTEEPKVAKEEFLPKSLIAEKSISPESIKSSNVHPGTSEAYIEHAFPSDEPKKINRHRSLHTNKQRKFYPYFFSRMLG